MNYSLLLGHDYKWYKGTDSTASFFTVRWNKTVAWQKRWINNYSAFILYNDNEILFVLKVLHSVKVTRQVPSIFWRPIHTCTLWQTNTCTTDVYTRTLLLILQLRCALRNTTGLEKSWTTWKIKLLHKDSGRPNTLHILDAWSKCLVYF